MKQFIEKKVIDIHSKEYAFKMDLEKLKTKYPGIYCVYSPSFEIETDMIFMDLRTKDELFPKLIKPRKLEIDDSVTTVVYDYVHGHNGGVGERMNYIDLNNYEECSKEFVKEVISRLNNSIGQTLNEYNKFSGVGE